MLCGCHPHSLPRFVAEGIRSCRDADLGGKLPGIRASTSVFLDDVSAPDSMDIIMEHLVPEPVLTSGHRDGYTGVPSRFHFWKT